MKTLFTTFLLFAACTTPNQSVDSLALAADAGPGSNVALVAQAPTAPAPVGIAVDPSTDLVVHTLVATAPIGIVNGTPAAIYTAGTVGIGDTPANTPGTFLDIRHNWREGWDDFEVVNAGPHSSHGIAIDWVRSHGTVSAPTTTNNTEEILRDSKYGYDLNNAIREGMRERWTVDQPTSAVAVPMRLDLWHQRTDGVMVNRFRFDSAGHFSVLDPIAPTLTNCGALPTISGSDQFGTITEGAMAPGCTLTFHQSWATTSAPSPVHCTVTSQEGLRFSYIVAYTAIFITNVEALSSTKLSYSCGGAGPL